MTIDQAKPLLPTLLMILQQHQLTKESQEWVCLYDDNHDQIIGFFDKNKPAHELIVTKTVENHYVVEYWINLLPQPFNPMGKSLIKFQTTLTGKWLKTF